MSPGYGLEKCQYNLITNKSMSMSYSNLKNFKKEKNETYASRFGPWKLTKLVRKFTNKISSLNLFASTC